MELTATSWDAQWMATSGYKNASAARREVWARYMASRDWQKLRLEIIRRADSACERCGRAEPLQVHHETYIRRFHERLSDLKALCDDCHAYESGRSDFDPRVAAQEELEWAPPS